MNYIFLILTIVNLQYEVINSQETSEDGNGRAILLMNDHGQRSDQNDIEAKRRSLLDNNFMRLGRSVGVSKKWFLPSIRALRSDEDKGSSFIRFGRRDPSFGTDDSRYETRSGSNFIRFGRNDAGDYDFTPMKSVRADDRGSNFIRFGKRDYDLYDDIEVARRGDDGKGSNFIRFGKRDDDGNNRVKRSLKDERDANRDQRNNFIRFGRDNDCPLCHLHSMLNPLLTKYQQFPIWVPRNRDLAEDKKADNRHLNSIRFG